MKPTEVRLVADTLEAAMASDEVVLEDLAKQIIGGLDEKRSRDDSAWAAVVYMPLGESSGVWKGLGPFSTKLAAHKAANALAAPGPQPGVARIVRLERDSPSW